MSAQRGTALTLVSSVGNQGEYRLRSARVAIGSDSNNDLVIDEPTVSRRHAEVIQRSGVFQIRDLGSTNGTFVNGARVDAPTPIAASDEIRLGGVRFYVRAEAPAQPARRRFSHAPVVFGVLLALSALSYQFVRNWRQLLDGADTIALHQTPLATPLPPPRLTAPLPAKSVSVATPLPPKSTPASMPSVAAAVTPAPIPKPLLALPSWLALVNRYRQLAHLGPVVEDPNLSRADRLHAEYLVRNFPEAIRHGGVGAEAHREDPRRPNYTDEGARAASGSLAVVWEMPPQTGKESTDDLSVPFLTAPPSQALAPQWFVEDWLSVPFHRPQILNPLLKKVGYGMYCASGLCAAALDAHYGASVAALPDPPAKQPIEFPSDGAQVTVRGFYDEWPDPRSSCAGYNPPSGLPITIQLGNWVSVKLQDFAVRRIDATQTPLVEACAFDETTYRNPDPSLQALVRGMLQAFGMVVVIPRRPLETAARYHVTMTVNGTKYDWSFSTPKKPGQRAQVGSLE